MFRSVTSVFTPNADVVLITAGFYAPVMHESSDQILPPVVLISIGNTRTRVALAEHGEIEPATVVDSADAAAIARAASEAVDGGAADGGGAADTPLVLLASVNSPAAEAAEKALKAAGFARVTRFGRDVHVPLEHSLDDDSTVGQDRLLDALGAFAKSEQACVVIDAGTAITVDFIDGTGVFCGGAIAPGVRMMLDSLHTGTAALPKVELVPERIPGEHDEGGSDTEEGGGGRGGGPFGKSTAPAMLLGAVSAARGLVHLLVDKYAEFYGAYPRIIATGGDAPLLFADDPIVEHIVPDLTLIGMLAAYQRLHELAGDDDAGA